MSEVIHRADSSEPSGRGFDVRRGDQPMVTGLVGAALAVAGPVSNAYAIRSDESLRSYALTAWLFVLGAALVPVDYLARRSHLRSFVRAHQPFARVTRSALCRWLAWGVILGVGWFVYSTLENYTRDTYDGFRRVLFVVAVGWGVLGLGYYLVTLPRRWGVAHDRSDPAVLVAMAARRVLRDLIAARPILPSVSRIVRARSHQRVWCSAPC